VRILWTPPPGTSGRYRIAYYGDAKAASGALTPVSAVSAEFDVNAV
jgi:neutral ceramidase